MSSNIDIASANVNKKSKEFQTINGVDRQAEIAELPSPEWPPAISAKWYAEKLGWKVFPVSPETKRPLIQSWPAEATSDPKQIDRWWRQHPGAMIGVVCGPRSEIAVVDVDNKADESGQTGIDHFGELELRFGKIDSAPLAYSASGGWHFYFSAPSLPFPKTEGRIAAKVDTRSATANGDGVGYIIAPGSVRESGKYEWAEATTPDQLVHLPDAPDWLALRACFTAAELTEIEADKQLSELPALPRAEWRSAFDAHKAAQRRLANIEAATEFDPQQAYSLSHPYVSKVIESELDAVRGCSADQNRRLFVSSATIGNVLAGAGLASADDLQAENIVLTKVRDRLFDAAMKMIDTDRSYRWDSRDGQRAASETIKSGLARGLSDPRDLSQLKKSAGASALEAEADRLAALSELEYEQQREDAAEQLGVRVKVLDKQIADRRKALARRSTGDFLADDEPWPDTVSGDRLAEDVAATLKRHAVLPTLSDVAIALWVLHAHAHDAAAHSPILTLNSPEKRCGKTTVAKLIGALVPRGLHTTNVTPAALFRVIQEFQPTLIVDEADTFMKLDPELQGIINGSHDRGSAFVVRVEGEGNDRRPVPFNTWSPKVLAGIGAMPSTIEDRSVIVPLRRKLASETAARLPIKPKEAFSDQRRQAARWAADNIARLNDADPQLPKELNDRAADNWRPLIAIADLIGGRWPELARQAAITLNGGAGEEDERTKLIEDIVELFKDRERREIPAHELPKLLSDLPDSPWGDFRHGNGISAQTLSKLLRPFGIKSQKRKNGNFYTRDQFNDAYWRYVDALGGIDEGVPFDPEQEA